MTCALAAKDYGLATIVGEETGEPAVSTGEVYALTTPGLGLRAYLTTKVFLAPKPHPNGQGVVPDVAVSSTPADAAAGRDPVMTRVLAMIAGLP
jgi:C-terminal processing protease CtpA/Prc